MDNIRLLLILSLAAILFLIYQAWVQDYGSPAQPAKVASQTDASVAADQPPLDAPDAPPATPVAQPAGDNALPAVAGAPAGSIIKVETDVIRAEISSVGGTLQALWLLDYAQTADDPSRPFQLLKPDMPNMFVVQSGLLGNQGQIALPTHKAHFTSTQSRFSLPANEDTLTVTLHWTEGGIEVRKHYHFQRGSYLVRVEQEIVNQTDAALALRTYEQLQRTELYDPEKSSFIHTFTGGVYYGPETKYRKESFGDMADEPLDVKITDGWIAMIQHYFMASWIPPQQVEQTFYTKVVGNDHYIIGTYSPALTINPGESRIVDTRLFVGPKLQNTLEEIAPGLELAVDYGWLTILSKPIFWLLNAIHSLVGNWGWAIIILTILIKLAFYKLSETSYKSMANMKKLAPRLQALKDRYGDDKERLNQAMMEMYKKEKINPLGGCLPILVQIPVFIALYWVLLESVELRHAPFILWLDNLTAPDPYYVLPLIMGVSMFVQQKLNPPPPDPIQAKVLMALPFVFTVFFAFFPSGLVLYWTVNQLLSITQQWHITRKIEKAEATKRAN